MDKAVLEKFLQLLGVISFDLDMNKINIHSKEKLVGKTISELCEISNFKGVAIFDLNEGGDYGKRIWEGIFVKEFIKEFPDHKNATVEVCDDFYGELVLRIRR